MKTKKTPKSITKTSCECPITDRKPLGGTAWNENVDLYYCEKHGTIDLFYKLTKDRYEYKPILQG